jgi:Holliday junction resolvasome RuvABC endonuclease subunit
MYIWAFDLSMSNTGVCIFDEGGNPVLVTSIPTHAKFDHGRRLKEIADFIVPLREQFPTNLIVLEKGFTKFNTSTQVIFRVHGLVNYLFWDCTQVYYAATTIKKVVAGNGRAKKDELKKVIIEKFPNLTICDDDQSDAVSIGLTYFNQGR